MNISFKKEEEYEWNLINKVSYENGWNSPTDGSPHTLLPIQGFALVPQNLKKLNKKLNFFIVQLGKKCEMMIFESSKNNAACP